MSNHVTDFQDHERQTLDRFRCPQCGMPLDLIELRSREVKSNELTVFANCAKCHVFMNKAEWERRRVA